MIRRVAWAALMLPGPFGYAATAYVSDQLVLGVYAAQSSQSARLATLHSGDAVETVSANGEFTQVRLVDGRTGWVRTAYLVTAEPATVRVRTLQDELDRAHATTPELAEAAERSEVARLTAELAALKAAGPPAARTGALSAPRPASEHIPAWVAAVLAALACGFWLGYAVLARRVRAKFGGIKVY